MSDLMKDPMILRSIIMDHYEYPRNHELTKEDGYVQKHMASESCIDDIYVQSRIRDGVVEDVRFDGVACTISTASTSIMSELLKGKRVEEAKDIIANYFHMISGTMMRRSWRRRWHSTMWEVRPTGSNAPPSAGRRWRK